MWKQTQAEKVVFSSHSAIFAVPKHLSSKQPLHHNLLHMISLLRIQQTVCEMCNLPAIVQELWWKAGFSQSWLFSHLVTNVQGSGLRGSSCLRRATETSSSETFPCTLYCIRISIIQSEVWHMWGVDWAVVHNTNTRGFWWPGLLKPTPNKWSS